MTDTGWRPQGSVDSVNIGNLINFLDDGPSVSSNDDVVLEDDDLANGIDGGPNDDSAPQMRPARSSMPTAPMDRAARC